MKKEIRKEEIINAARKIIIERGYKKTSVQEITNEVGIAKGSFYTYFKSKSELVIDLVLDKISEIKEKNEKILEEEMSLANAFERYAYNVAKLPLEDPKFFIIMMRLFDYREDLEKNVREELCSLHLKRGAFVRRILNKYKEEIDIVKEGEIERYVGMIAGLVDTYYENVVAPVVSDSLSINSIDIKETEKLVNKIDINYEVEFMKKCILKLILK
ncbi:TetR/AcrR family transcriptional regulator [Fusobacterium sp. MFO224]|uniref:TetR/AcrR family transcriptional regulator n=1 Tax=Fusobacterium sp. MFO224 TaxID=3378070 RepID=UPI0038543E22